MTDKNLTLGQKQRKLTYMVAQLIIYAYSKGYEMTLGDAYRDPRLHGEVGTKKGYGAPKSLHKSRLAIDFNLFVDGVYITDSGHPAYKDITDYWKEIGGTSGIDFNDANHFSIEHQGRK